MVDPFAPGTMTVNTYGSGTIPPGILYQFDKLIHIKVLDNRANGDMVVTGSMGTNNGSGSFVMVIDQNCTPGTAVVVEDSSADFLRNEYAFDANENIDGSWYIYSNKFWPGRQTPGIIGFVPNGRYPMVTLLNSSFLATGPSGWHRVHLANGAPLETNTSFAWGTTLLKTEYTGQYPNGSFDERHRIAGFIASWNNTICEFVRPPHLQPSVNNPIPFMLDMSINRVNGDIVGSGAGGTWDWETYATQTATSNFNSLGGELSNVCWPARIGVLNNAANDNIVLIGPRINDLVPASSNTLNFKAIGTDGNGDLNTTSATCNDTRNNCPPMDVNKNRVTTLHFSSTFYDTWTISTVNRTSGNSEIISNWINDNYDCVSTSHYKPTDVNDVQQTSFTLHPNPASKFVTISTDALIDSRRIKTELIDLLGSKVSTLYEGTATGLKTNSKLNLPSVPSGLYIIRISSEGQLLHQEKLSIR